jgi:hypothetical protein
MPVTAVVGNDASSAQIAREQVKLVHDGGDWSQVFQH